MSGILGVFEHGAATLPDERAVHRMVAALRERGREHVGVLRDEASVIAVTRHAWELDADFSGPVLTVSDGDVTVAADASLYYRDELKKRLASCGVAALGETPSHLLLAAFRAWGPACTDRLEGDWAFLIWDRRSRSVFCARDFAGSRTLYYAVLGGTLVVASSLESVVRHPRLARELNPVALAQVASGLLASSEETCYRGVSLLPAGCSLEWRDGRLRLTRHFEPRLGETSELSWDQAAEELRALLSRSVKERAASTEPTSVWLSGGYDSPAVFAAGAESLGTAGASRRVQAVSLSFPEGDSGREDELIEAVARHRSSEVAWIDTRTVPLLEDAERRAKRRDDPFAHAFEGTNRALARRSRELGSRVTFAGYGGDQLFGVSEIYLAELLRTGRWLSLRREWRAEHLRGSGFRSFFRLTMQPVLPGPLRSLATLLRGGRPLRRYLERPLPEWIDAGFAAAHGLLEREVANTPARAGLPFDLYEMYWYLTTPYGTRVTAAVHALAVDEGVEVRCPLYDRRIVELAGARPRAERRSGGESKRLLRHAMRGLLPPEILAPRRHRTGTTHDYLARSLRVTHAELVSKLLGARLLLAELGIVDAEKLRQRWNEYRRWNDHVVGLQLFTTLQTELWLRARVRRAEAAERSAPELAAATA